MFVIEGFCYLYRQSVSQKQDDVHQIFISSTPSRRLSFLRAIVQRLLANGSQSTQSAAMCRKSAQSVSVHWKLLSRRSAVGTQAPLSYVVSRDSLPQLHVALEDQQAQTPTRQNQSQADRQVQALRSLLLVNITHPTPCVCDHLQRPQTRHCCC